MPTHRTRVSAVALLLVASTVVWRRGDVFTGSFDLVVVAKAALSGLALVCAALGGRTGRRRLGTGSCWAVTALVAVSVLGALGHGTLAAGAVVAVRVLVLAATLVLLLRLAPALEVLGRLVWACGVVAVVATGTALYSPSSLVRLPDGRLFGGLPPLNPNDLAFLAGVVVVWTAWRTVLGDAGWREAAAGVAAFGVLWLTGSRTGLLMVLAGVAVMALHLRRPRAGLVVGGLVGAALAVLGLAATGALASYLARGDTGTSTLDSRFVAWHAAGSWASSTWEQLLGGGLSVKMIPVSGVAWDTQLLDSSWVSALVQTGLVGLVLAAVWVLWAFRGALLAPRPHRVLFLGFLVYLVGRSLLESGLFDATPAFLFFCAVSLLAEGGTRARLVAESGGPGAEGEPDGAQSRPAVAAVHAG